MGDHVAAQVDHDRGAPQRMFPQYFFQARLDCGAIAFRQFRLQVAGGSTEYFLCTRLVSAGEARPFEAIAGKQH